MQLSQLRQHHQATAAADGSSIVVQSGEGAGSIAARAGISVDELERLNPDHMTNGYWYANQVMSLTFNNF